jgi:hypothetical protein
MKKESSTNL